MTDLLTTREKMLVVSTAVLAFMAGLWLGIWSMPARALDVPITSFAGPDQNPVLAYRPVPTWLLPGSLFVCVLLLVWLRKQYADLGESSDDHTPAITSTDD